jgi:hypothetical protein
MPSARIACAIVLAGAAALTFAAPLPPADAGSAPTLANAQRLAWFALRGSAVELSVGEDGSAYAVDASGVAWLRRADRPKPQWTRLPGSFSRIAAVRADLAWGLARDGGLRRYNGRWWETLDAQARDVAVGAGGTVYLVRGDGTLARYDPARGAAAMMDPPQPAVRVAVGTRDLPWALAESGAVFRFDGLAWQRVAGAGRALAAREDAIFMLTPEGLLQRRDETRGAWSSIAARGRAIAVDAMGRPWIATESGQIFSSDPSLPAARSSAAGAGNPLSQIIAWRSIRGNARALAIAQSGAVLALDRDGNVWQLRGKDWQRLPGRLQRIAIEPDGTPWGIDAEAHILRYQGSFWRTLPGSARDVAVGASGAVWIVGMDGTAAQWDAKSRQWLALQAGAEQPIARRLAVDPLGRPWVIDDQRLVRQFDGTRWIERPGVQAEDIAVGPEGTVFAAGADRRPYRLDRERGNWVALNGEATAVGVGPNGLPWIANAQGAIFAAATFEQERAAAADASPGGAPDTNVSVVPPPPANVGALPTSREPLGLADFTRIPNAVERDLAIGNDGSVFALGVDGTLAQWSNAQNRFNAFPGSFARIAVAPDGRPWGVTGINEIFRHDGRDWRPVYNTLAVDIAINAGGTVIVAGTDEFLYAYNAPADRFDRMLPASDLDPAPTGVRVAVDPRGRPWTIGRDGRVRRCDRGPCEILPQGARDIDIGPEGSIFIVDPDFRLRRFNTATEQWDLVGIDATEAAVGPGGRPWIANGKAEVWQSAFFRRDESRDTQVAVASSGNTTTSSTPVFTFLLNMPFDRVTLPAGFAPGPTPMVRLASAMPDRIVMVDAAFVFWAWDSTRKLFVRDRSVSALPWTPGANNTIRSLAIALDGAYWVSNAPVSDTNPQNTGIWRRQSGQWVRVIGLNDCASTPGCTAPQPASIAIGPDGSVYATSHGGNIHRYDPLQQRFLRVPIPPPSRAPVGHIAVDPSGKLWATTQFTGTALPSIFEYTGSAWVSRFTDAEALAPCLDSPYDSPCVSIGPNGLVYQLWDLAGPTPPHLRRWNAQTLQWDLVSTSPTVGTFVIGSDNRPWVWDGTSVLYRAR